MSIELAPIENYADTLADDLYTGVQRVLDAQSAAPDYDDIAADAVMDELARIDGAAADLVNAAVAAENGDADAAHSDISHATELLQPGVTYPENIPEEVADRLDALDALVEEIAAEVERM